MVFLLSMLIPAMYYGEDIEVQADISPKLLYNLRDYQYLIMGGYHLSQVEIRCQKIKEFVPQENLKAVLLTYSGDTDSTFTL